MNKPFSLDLEKKLNFPLEKLKDQKYPRFTMKKPTWKEEVAKRLTDKIAEPTKYFRKNR